MKIIMVTIMILVSIAMIVWSGNLYRHDVKNRTLVLYCGIANLASLIFWATEFYILYTKV